MTTSLGQPRCSALVIIASAEGSEEIRVGVELCGLSLAAQRIEGAF
jgi:hypothetical protein